MARELAFVLINPYTIAKSRTGGVIARYVSRTDLELVAARMYGPSVELVRKYADLVRAASKRDGSVSPDLIPDYILKSYAPDPASGRPRRVMLLLFEGEDAVAKIWRVTGSATLKSGSGETIRDTYGDYVLDEQEAIKYFEPAVLVGPSRARSEATLRLWARYAARDGGITATASDVPGGTSVQQTLVLLKPDNFRYPSSRAGNIIDILSSSGLRIVGVKKFSMTVAQAEEFYGPILDTLRDKFVDIGSSRASRVLEKELGFGMPPDVIHRLCEELGPFFAQSQFECIVEFMTGYRPSKCSRHEKTVLGRENCLALVYEGVEAVRKIRALIGPTDPTKAQPGSVRREYGSNIMVNAVHASDSTENAKREMKIIRVEEDSARQIVERHYGGMFARFAALRTALPRARSRATTKMRGLWKQPKS